MVSCQSYKNKKKLQRDLSLFINSKIEFPSNLIPFQLHYGLTSIDLLERYYKIVIFIDSTECNDCRIKMLKQGWEPFLNQIANDSLSCIIIFNTSTSHEIKNTMEELGLKIPYFLDIDASFPKINKQIKLNKNFQTFLTINNKVVIAGDPTANPKLKQLYLKVI